VLNVLPQIWQINLLVFSVINCGGGGGGDCDAGYFSSGEISAVSSGLGLLG
jgi:hypothetical protein